MLRKIPLTQGKYALVDDKDFERITRFKWLYDRGYARRRFQINYTQHCMHMHREVMQTPNGFEVDHINGDRLDNRKSNLRVVSHQRNMFNMSSHKNSSSRFKGVYWNKEKSKWSAQIGINGKSTHIGHFETEETAAEAYNQAAIKHFGEYAKLN